MIPWLGWRAIMITLKKGIHLSLIAASLLAGCGGAENIGSNQGGGTTPPSDNDASSLFFGKGATSTAMPMVQSEKDAWAVKAVTATQVSMQSIGAVLINNAGQNDTADVQVSGDGDGTFMLKSDSAINLTKYAAGFINFEIRAKSAAPQSMSVSIDNEYPNRSSLPIAKYLNSDGNWQKLVVPVACMKPFPGATAVDLSAVHTPFHLGTTEKFDYEITNVRYVLTTTDKPVVDPVTCADGTDPTPTPTPNPDAGSGVNAAPALVSADAAIYYSGDASKAASLAADYPLNSFGVDKTDADSVLSVSYPGNGGLFFGADSSNKDLSAYQDGSMTFDLKVNSYGASPELQLRADGTAGPDYGTFVTINSGVVPADGTWYRCHFPYNAMIPVSNMSSVQKALYVSGAWDSMAGMNFALTNVALLAAPTDANDVGCKKL